MRARNIKPGFFENEDLADCGPLAQILFAALWCLADRAGRMEDRPKRIKAKALPYYDCDADELLDLLQQYGFIQRYQFENKKFIQILNFEKHQHPHCKESPSSIPAPDKHSASTVQVPDKHNINPSDSGFSDSLIPDSGFSDSEERKADAVASSSPEKKSKEYVAEIQTQEKSSPLRITKQQAEKWQQTFKFIDVEAELYKLGLWSEENPEKRWTKKSAFHATARALGNSNQRALYDQHARDPTFDPSDPNGDKEAEAKKRKILELTRSMATADPYGSA